MHHMYMYIYTTPVEQRSVMRSSKSMGRVAPRGAMEEGFLKTLSDQRGAMPNYPHIYIMCV